MKSVFLLQHSYTINEVEETKIIGIFSSRENAEQCIEKNKTLPGFREYPDSFYLDEYEVDKLQWKEGFHSIS